MEAADSKQLGGPSFPFPEFPRSSAPFRNPAAPGEKVTVRLTVGDSGGAPEGGPVSHITLENCVIQGPMYAGVDGTPGPCNYLTFRRVEVSGAGQGGEESYAAAFGYPPATLGQAWGAFGY